MRFIAGSGRSGTTWVLDALAAANGLRPVFEPLHPYVSEVGNLYAHRALTAEEDHPDLVRFLSDVSSGRTCVFWTKYRRQVRWLFPPPADFSTRRDAGRVWRHWVKFVRDTPRLAIVARGLEPILKCIRANLMLDWLSRGQQWRVVLIIRHPGAVIESELRGSWSPEFPLDRFRSDKRLHELTFGRYQRLLDRNLSHIEALAARWVVENQWVMEQAASSGFTVVHYEDLRTRPDVTWPRVIDALGLAHAPNSDLLEKPSQQSSPVVGDAFQASRSTRWQHSLSKEQIFAIQKILDEVNCAIYSMSDPEPLHPGRPSSILFAGGNRP
jgi:hypothetical protein